MSLLNAFRSYSSNFAIFAHWPILRNFDSAFHHLTDRYRQFRALPGDDELRRAVLSPQRTPIEGARYKIGECLRAYSLSGRCRRLKICGVQSGGFSNVYIVIDLDEMKPYCLKENRALPGDERKKNEALKTEANIVFTIGNHPNLATPCSAFYINDRFFILTEYISGYSLDFSIRKKRLDLATTLKYAIHICRAVTHAQAVLPGFIHGDVKPGNCLITLDGALKLTDFGLASALGVGKHNSNLANGDGSTNNKRWGGTTAYMAPEMFDPESPSRELADVYAFGVTLFEMIAGVRPFAASGKSEVIDMHRHSPIPLDLLAGLSVPERLIDLVSRCMSKIPADRPKSFAVLQADLLDISLKELKLSFSDDRPLASETPMTDRVFSLAVLENHDMALICLERSATDGIGAADYFAQKALVLNQANRNLPALAASAKALRFEPQSFLTQYARARTLFSAACYEEAGVCVDRALRLQPRNAAALELKAKLLLRNGRQKKAKRFFEASIWLDSSRIEPYTEIAGINLKLGRINRALWVATKAAKINGQNPGLLKILGEIYLSRNQLVESIDCLKNSLRLAPYSVETGRLFVRSCSNLHRSLCHVVDTEFLKVIIKGARLSHSDGKPKAASAVFTNKLIPLLTNSDEAPMLLYYLDEVIISLSENLDLATRKRFIKILCNTLDSHRFKPLTAYSLSAVGKLFYQFGEYENCINAFSTLLREHGPDEKSYYYLGVCHEVLDNPESSLEFYKKGLNLNKGHELTRTAVRRVGGKVEDLKNQGGMSEKRLSVAIM